VRDDELSTCNEGFEGRPMVRFDGLEIVFVSDRPGGSGLPPVLPGCEMLLPRRGPVSRLTGGSIVQRALRHEGVR
jgi:hypothetical protein